MNSLAFKLSVILTLTASCLADKCWWWAEITCQKQPCPNVHFMWRGFDSSSNLSVQFLCPQTDGHDVVLCEHPNYTGECYTTSIPKGKDCANVEAAINNSASSVQTLGGCIRLYDDADCQGKMTVFQDSNANLTELGDSVSSVGLCTKEDHPRGGCNHASPEGRLECQKHKCYWSAEPNCGDSSTCGDDHFISEGYHSSSCHNESTKFCCPKSASAGHDVVVCEHADLKGDCIVTNIPNGQTCVNTEMNDWGSSVHSLGRCIQLYQDANCEKLMMTIYDKTDFAHNFPPDLDNILTSVGLCSDKPDNGSTSGGRANFLFFFLFLAFSFVVIGALLFIRRGKGMFGYRPNRLI